jgi:ribosomal protein S4
MRIDTKLYGDCRGMLCAFQHCMALSGSLPNVCFRLGFGPTVPGARQFVNHGHITVNGRVVDIPSYQCRAGDVIAVRERKASRLLAEANLAFPGLSNIPPTWNSTSRSSPPR